MSARLLDANVLIALFDADHVHHGAVRDWFIALRDGFATCPIVEGALMHWIVRIEGNRGTAAAQRELATASGPTISLTRMLIGKACSATARSPTPTLPYLRANTAAGSPRSTADSPRCITMWPNWFRFQPESGSPAGRGKP